jgi:hypothetical protein
VPNLLAALQGVLGPKYDPAKRYGLGRPDDLAFAPGYEDTGEVLAVGEEMFVILVKD